MPGAIMLPGMHRKGLQKSRQFPWRSENDPIINYNFIWLAKKDNLMCIVILVLFTFVVDLNITDNHIFLLRLLT